MTGAAGVNDQCRIGELLHQAAGATGMIEMDVGGHDIGNSLGRYALTPQHFQQYRHRIVSAGVDKACHSLVFQKIASGQAPTLQHGIDAGNPMAQVLVINRVRRRRVLHCYPFSKFVKHPSA